MLLFVVVSTIDIYTKRNLQELTQLPVLGVVSRIWTPGQRMRRRFEVTSFAAGSMCLMLLFVVVSTIDIWDLEIADRGVRETLLKITERLL
jgi:hypothetical protein